MSSAGGSRTYSLDPSSGGASFARLMFGLLRQRFTGTVILEQRAPAGERTIWVRGGMPVFSDWDSPGDRLGELLIESGKLDAPGLERALAAQAEAPRPLGEILVELELIDASTLSRALRSQCSRKLVRVFAPHASEGEATVSAVDHDKGGEGDILGQINGLALIHAGVSAHYDEARVEAELGAALDGDLVASPPFARYEAQFGFAVEDASILAGLARGASVERLVSPQVSRKRVVQLIYVLWVTQMLRSEDDATQAIAKGATAAAAAAELGVTIGQQTPAKAKAKSAAKPPPAPKSKSKSKPPPPPKAKSKPAAKPPPAAKPEATASETAVDAKFEAELERLEQLVADEANAFRLFGLELDADRKAVRATWAELSKAFHPDSLGGRGLSALRPRVEQVFAALSEAYGVLNNKDERAKLRDALEVGGEDLKANQDANALVRNAFEAEMIARDADKLLKAKQWAKAAERYAKATELSPQDFDIAAGLHYARYRAGEPEPELAQIAIEALAKITEEQPKCARAFYFQGLLYLGLDNSGAAKANFTKAHQLDPRNIDAERQLRAIRLREHGPSKPKKSKSDNKKSGFGGLRNLFKKS